MCKANKIKYKMRLMIIYNLYNFKVRVSPHNKERGKKKKIEKCQSKKNIADV